MNSRPQPVNSLSAFTLIELLTVITIIAILMGLLFPAVGIVKDQAKKAQAKADVTNIAAAVKQYYTEYGKYPVGGAQVSVGSDLTFDGSSKHNVDLFDIIRNYGTPNQYNPRSIVFFDAKTVSDPTSPRAGLLTQDANGIPNRSYVDPWGKEYEIAVDSDYDNIIKPTGTFYNDFQGDNAPHTGVCVWSLGKDGILGEIGRAHV